MALAGGTLLGPYEIASALGAGGPPSFAYASTRELRRSHAVAPERRGHDRAYSGPYTVLAELGADGMGEFYRARDTKLNRDVAIKVLSGAVTHDAERRERFEREALTIAALNRPNIVTIHAAEHVASGGGVAASGENAGDDAFRAMELVEGRPLPEVIPRGDMRR
jgi:serine/threonine protein kinase